MQRNEMNYVTYYIDFVSNARTRNECLLVSGGLLQTFVQVIPHYRKTRFS